MDYPSLIYNYHYHWVLSKNGVKMNYYIDLFSPETYERFGNSTRTISGFRLHQKSQAARIHPGDKLICYMTKFSRWVGVLEVTSDYFVDSTPIFSDLDDPFVVRFNVKPVCWLEKDLTIPIHEDRIWQGLSFTKDLDKTSIAWTGKVRGSLTSLSYEDGEFLEEHLVNQEKSRVTYSIDSKEYGKKLHERVLTPKGSTISVSIPDNEPTDEVNIDHELRSSLVIQSKLAMIGEKLGFSIWIPRNDRSRILQQWKPLQNTLLDTLPLNYDEVTLRTIEQIDILWLRRRAIIRAFEIEHTTSVYSGILRMADLLALQPNMDIKLHIVAPDSRRDKVFSEIKRPVFSLLDKGPLSELCSFLTYESINQISALQHLDRMVDSLIEDYEVFAP